MVGCFCAILELPTATQCKIPMFPRLFESSLHGFLNGLHRLWDTHVNFCRGMGVEAEVVLASMGPHGHPMVDKWTMPCEKWLKKHGWQGLKL